MPSFFSMQKVLFVFLLSLLFYSYSYAEPSQYGKEIAKKAIEEEAYLEREWNVLMQYKKPAGRKIRSLVDDERFFLAENGKYSPKDELEATILSLFDNELSKDDDNKHPVCLFAGRREWIIERFNVDRNKLPKKSCSDYEKVREKIDPTSITVIFPFMYLKNPASMFGHTMLRINNSRKDPLTSYSVTFAASVESGTNMLKYAVLGLFGGYDGYYTVKEYYKTIYEYGNADNRDIWEYDLNFTKEETIRLFNHLWELQDIGSQYFFFDENCSYSMLMLLESARPSLNLSKSILWEAPTDSIKLIRDEGLIVKKEYRPSHIKLLNIYTRGMSRSAIALAHDLARSKKTIDDVNNSPYSLEEKVKIYDLAIETMRFEFIQRDKVTDEIFDEYKEKTIMLLSARARLGVKSVNKIDVPSSPDMGHDISRVKIGVGAENFKDFYTEAGFQLGFHSLDDIDNGFIPNSQLTVLDINVRWNTNTGYVNIPEASLIKFGAYTPLSHVLKNVSWKFEIAGEEKEFRSGSKYFTPYLRGGVGITLGAGGFTSYLTADVDLAFAKGYNPYYTGLGFGGNLGLMYSFKGGKLLAEGYYRYYVLENLGAEFGAEALYAIPVTQNNSIEINYKYKNYWDRQKHDLGLFWRVYF